MSQAHRAATAHGRRAPVVQHYRIDADPARLRATLVAMRCALPSLDDGAWRTVQRGVVSLVARSPGGAGTPTRPMQLDVHVFDDRVRLESRGDSIPDSWMEVDRADHGREAVSR